MQHHLPVREPHALLTADELTCSAFAAFVADIYSQSVIQGPSLPQAQRSQLTKAFSSNPQLWVSRIQAALEEVNELMIDCLPPCRLLLSCTLLGTLLAYKHHAQGPMMFTCTRRYDGVHVVHGCMLYDAILLLQLRGMEDVVDPTRLAAMGYCFGGGGVIQLLHAYPNNTDGLLGEILQRSSGIVPVSSEAGRHLALLCQGFSTSCPHRSMFAAGVVGFHSSLPTMFTQPLELDNPVRALFFNGYNDPGAPPQNVDNFLVCFVASCQLSQ